MAKKDKHSNEEEEAKTPIPLTKGSKVEVWSTEDGFESALFPATVVGQHDRTDGTVFVRYEHITNETGSLLVEKVRVSDLRPTPPEERDLMLEPNDVVDAFHKEVWWKGFVVKIFKEMYTVAFKDPPDVLELPRSDLRPHCDWVDNSKWVRAQKEQATTGQLFTLGMKIEIDYSDKPGTTWMPAFYLGKSKETASDFHLVKTRAKKVSQVIQVEISRIRPSPPKTKKKDCFELLDKVDAFYGTLWISGVVTKILVRKRYAVTFEHGAKEMEFDHSKLRPHVDWNNGLCVTLNPEINQAVQSPPVDKSSNKETVSADDELAENVPLMKYKKLKGSKNLFPLKSAREEVGQMENRNALSAEKRGPSRKSLFDNGQTDLAIEESQLVVKPKEVMTEKPLGELGESQLVVKPKEVMTEKPSGETNDNGVSCEQNWQLLLRESPNENLQGNGNCINADAVEDCTSGLVTDSRARVSPSDGQDISLAKNVNECGNIEAIDTPTTPFLKCSPVWKLLKATKEFTKYPQNPHFRPLMEFNEMYREGTALGHMVNYANLIDKTSKLSKSNSREEISRFVGEFSFFEELGFDVKEVRAGLNKLLETKVELEKLDQLKDEIGQFTEEVVELNDEVNKLMRKRKLLDSEITERESKIAKLSKEAVAIKKRHGLCVGD